jgi:hypothetical protein
MKGPLCGLSCYIGADKGLCEVRLPGGHTYGCGGPRLLEHVREELPYSEEGLCNWCGQYGGVCGCEEALLQRLADALNRPDADQIALGDAEMEPDADSKPDFNGKWHFTSTTSSKEEWEALMVDAEVGLFTRKAAHGASYGIGLAWHEITQDGDNIKIKTSNGFTTTTMEIVVNGEEQTAKLEDGNEALFKPNWKGGCLVLDGNLKKGKPMQKNRRFLKDAIMVVEATASTGQVVQRHFTKA